MPQAYQCLAPQGASGLKIRSAAPAPPPPLGLAPQGASGLKTQLYTTCLHLILSRPARGEWIENTLYVQLSNVSMGLAPQGASGLKKMLGQVISVFRAGLAPQGARGLKTQGMPHSPVQSGSRPARGEWIEMFARHAANPACSGLAPRGASGLKSLLFRRYWRMHTSRPARGEWIEMMKGLQN